MSSEVTFDPCYVARIDGREVGFVEYRGSWHFHPAVGVVGLEDLAKSRPNSLGVLAAKLRLAVSVVDPLEPGLCAVDGCDHPVRAFRLCSAHYSEWKGYDWRPPPLSYIEGQARLHLDPVAEAVAEVRETGEATVQDELKAADVADALRYNGISVRVAHTVDGWHILAQPDSPGARKISPVSRPSRKEMAQIVRDVQEGRNPLTRPLRALAAALDAQLLELGETVGHPPEYGVTSTGLAFIGINDRTAPAMGQEEES